MQTYNESFQLTDAAQLRDFLNQFKERDLSTVYFTNTTDRTPVDYINLSVIEETLSDGSTVMNFRISI